MLSFVHAEDFSAAVKDTQNLLENPARRPQDNAAVQKVKQLGDPRGQSEEIFKLSSQVFEKMAKDLQGDPAAMQKFLDEASRNPAAFAEQFSPEQKQRLKEIGDQLATPSTLKP